MSLPVDSQEFEAFLPLYDTIPESWEEGRQFIVENLKKISIAVNTRTIGFLLDEELLSGQQFIPGVTIPGNNPGIFRSVLRKTFEFGPIIIGVNPIAHDIVVDDNFTLIHIFASGTNVGALTGDNIPTVGYNVTDILVDSTKVYDLCVVVIEYIQEL